MKRLVQQRVRVLVSVTLFLFVANSVPVASAQIIVSNLFVTVSDIDTEQPIENASVTVSGVLTVSSDENGFAHIPLLSTGNHDVQVSRTGFETINFEVNANNFIVESAAELRTSYTLDSGPQYQVKNGSGTIVARFDQDGNLHVNGSITYGASTGQLAATSGKELLIKNGSTIVARLDASGNLYLKGDFQRRLSTISLGSSQAFRVKNSSGTTVAAIDEYGNLRILGGSNGF